MCHGPIALMNVESGDGKLVAGKQVTGFSNEEEEVRSSALSVSSLLAGPCRLLPAACRLLAARRSSRLSCRLVARAGRAG